MKEPTKEELEVIRYRQMHCIHAFIKGPCDSVPRCAHCGVSRADHEAMNPYIANGWETTIGRTPRACRFPFFRRFACVPTALAKLFDESYEAACQRLYAAGADYTRVEIGALHDVLEAERDIKTVYDPDVKPPFMAWRRHKRGEWVAVLTYCDAPTSHCIALKNGAILDNGWLQPTNPNILVHAAWQLEERA
jgi:hypothetical protein